MKKKQEEPHINIVFQGMLNKEQLDMFFKWKKWYDENTYNAIRYNAAEEITDEIMRKYQL